MAVRISPKHGANPTIPVCLYCGKEKDEIVICGRINRKDDQMPLNSVIDAIPCENCQELWKNGIVLIRACDTKHENMVPVTAQNNQKVWLDGSTILLREEAAQRMFDTHMVKGDRAYLEDKVFDVLMKQWDEMQEKSNQGADSETEPAQEGEEA